jgi:peptide/nickel transport system permease protein
MAALNGFRRKRIVWRYGLRNALVPGVIAMAQMGGYLMAGIIITENVFNYPGLGTMLVDAVAARDVAVVQVVAMIMATAYVAINIVADLLIVLLVPKLRTAA